ncbi:hypothetical protein JCM11251_006394 [Rhodosporidiobolus azoricus]
MSAALILVDVQYDFLPPSGALAVATGDAILLPVYRVLEEGKWGLVVASQDYHPTGHISFASRHGLSPFSSTQVSLPASRGGATMQQELWPDHCVQGTRGCELEEGVQRRLDEMKSRGGKVETVQKGGDLDLDAYSAFAIPLSAANQEESPLTRSLLDANLDTLVICGLATDFCVRATVLAALQAAEQARAGWRVLVVKEAIKGVFPEKEEEVLKEMEVKGAEIVSIDGEELRPFWRSHV